MIRTLAAAFSAGAALSLVIDATLQVALSTIRVAGGGSPASIRASVAEHSVWVLAGLALWLAAPTLGRAANLRAPGLPRPDAARLVGLGFVVLPIVRVLATWVVVAVRITARGTWDFDGRRFLMPSYYSELILANAPWILAGTVLFMAARHLSDD